MTEDEMYDIIRGYEDSECDYHERNIELEAENAKLRDIAHDIWRLLLATGNDDLVLSTEVDGVVKEVIDAEVLAKTMHELGIEFDEWQ